MGCHPSCTLVMNTFKTGQDLSSHPQGFYSFTRKNGYVYIPDIPRSPNPDRRNPVDPRQSLHNLVNPYLLVPLYYSVWFLLSTFCMHRLWLVFQYYRLRNHRPTQPQPSLEDLPSVLVQLPIFNERFVAERIIRAAASIQYPTDRMTIQVLDDSTDDTCKIIAALVRKLSDRKIRIKHIRRPNRHGYKAGALQSGMEQDHSELIAIFDADFIPPKDFLLNTVGAFLNRKVGMVQTRWEHDNREYSLLTRIQAILLDGHFVVEHTSRYGMGCFFNFNGTAGVWRRSAIESAGGWKHDTLTEDLDLSYRAQLKGWEFIYMNEITTPADLPANIRDYKSQQERWTTGSIQTARKILPSLIRSRIPLRCKFEASVHLLNNHCYGLMLMLAVLLAPVALQGNHPALKNLLWWDLPFFCASSVSIVIFYLTASVGAGQRPSRSFVLMPLLMGIGIGMAVNNTRAVIRGWLSGGGEFIRTPKNISPRKIGEHGPRGHDQHGGSSSRSRAGYSLPGQVLTPGIEFFFSAYSAWTVYLCILNGQWLVLPFMLLFACGFGVVCGLSLHHLLAGIFKTTGVQGEQVTSSRLEHAE